MEEYLKMSDKYQTIPAGYNQRFQYPITGKIKNSEIAKMINRGDLDKVDVLIAEFLYDVKFASYNQILRFLSSCIKQERIQVSDARRNIIKLMRSRIINRFYLSTEEQSKYSYLEYPKDAMSIYCLDIGGKYLLDSFSDRNGFDWNLDEVVKGSDKVAKSIVATEFYVSLNENLGGKLNYFKALTPFRIPQGNFRNTFSFSLRIDDKNRYFIGQIIRKEETLSEVRDNLLKYESRLTTNSYKKYYNDSESEPILFMISDDIGFLHQLAKEISEITKITKIRYSTEEIITTKELDEEGVFFEYVKETDKLETRATVIFNKETKI